MRELIAPVVGSTLTTVVVFVPLGLLSGVVGQFFRALSLTPRSRGPDLARSGPPLIPLLARFAARRHGEAVQHGHERPHRPLVSRECWDRHAPAGHRDRCAVLLAAAGAALFLRGRNRLPAGGGRRRIRHRLSVAGGHGAGGNQPHAPRRRRHPPADAGHRGLHAAHGIGAGPLRHAAEQRRHPCAADAADPAPIRGRDHLRSSRRS